MAAARCAVVIVDGKTTTKWTKTLEGTRWALNDTSVGRCSGCACPSVDAALGLRRCVCPSAALATKNAA